MSWKQYGGVKNIEVNRKSTTNTLVADEIIIKNSYIGGFSIRGILDVTGKVLVKGNLEISGLISTNDISLGQLHVYDKSFFFNNSDFYSDISCSNNITIGNSILINKNATIKNNITIGNILYFDSDNKKYIYANSNGMSINKIDPNASLNLLCNRIEGLNIQSDFSKNINIISSNKEQKGFVITTSNTDDNSFNNNIHLDFYVNKNINTNEKGDAYIKYKDSGVFEINASKKISALANFAVSNRTEEKYDNVFNESVVIYDNSNDIYNYNIYKNNSAITGDAISIITNDNSSNSFLRIVTPQKKGLGIVGGAYPNDSSRSMATIGLTDNSGNFQPTQMIVSGNAINKYKATMGINTYKPKIDEYILNINGPIHIDNGDIHIVNETNFEIISMNVSKNNPNFIIAIGSSIDISSINTGYNFEISKSKDYGNNWNSINITDYLKNISIPVKNYKLNDVFLYDSSYSFIIGTENLFLYSWNGATSWSHFVFTKNFNFNSVFVDKIDNSFNFFINGTDSSSNYAFLKFSKTITELSFGTTISILNNDIFTFSNNFIVNNFTIFNNKTFFATNNGICELSNNQINIISNTNSYNYNNIKSTNNKIIAIGNGICSVSSNGITFTNYSSTVLTNEIKKIWIYDNLNFLSISTKSIYFTTNGGIQWSEIPSSYLNQSGKYEIISDISNLFSNIIMSDSNTVLLSNTLQSYVNNTSYGKSNIINCFLPNLFNRINNNVLDICGNMNISGDFNINNGKIISKNDTFFLLNENVNSIYFGENSNYISMGNSISGNTNINTNLLVKKNITTNSDLIVNGKIFVNNLDSIQIGSKIISQIFVSIESNQTIIGQKIFTNQTIISNDSESSDIFNGALIISGGVGIRKKLNVGSTIQSLSLITGNLTVSNVGIGKSFSSYALDISGDLRINGNIIVNSIYSNNDLNIFTGNITSVINLANANNIKIGQNNNTTFTNRITIGSYDVSGNSIITIGGYNDIIRMNGDLTLPTVVKQFNAVVQFSKQATFFLKDNSGNQQAFLGGIVDENGNSLLSNSGTENGGLLFYDLSQNGLGYFLITNDYDGYKFKAPTYKNIQELNQDPSRNNQNIVKLDVNNLKTTAKNGLVILKESTNILDSKYTITGTNFDISNIFIKDTDISFNTQSISTKVIFNSSICINKTIGINNTIIDINGNAIISRLGIGTSSVNPNENSLEIKGNVYQLTDGYIYQF